MLSCMIYKTTFMSTIIKAEVEPFKNNANLNFTWLALSLFSVALTNKSLLSHSLDHFN